MYFNSGYLNNSRLDFKDHSKPLVVGSCGTYRLKKRPKLPTFWAKGRRDYQILYVASGKAHFWFDGVEEVVTSGHMVLYQPTEIQKYVYYVEDHPEVFWIHFTGYDVKNILNYHGIPLDKHVFYSGTLPDYKMLFRKIIRELQQCEYGYEDYIDSLFNSRKARKQLQASPKKSKPPLPTLTRIIIQRSVWTITQNRCISVRTGLSVILSST